MNEKQLVKLESLRVAEERAERAVETYFAELYPVGAPIRWLKNGNTVQFGYVVWNQYGRARVRNHNTGAELQIDIYHVIRGYHAEHGLPRKTTESR